MLNLPFKKTIFFLYTACMLMTSLIPMDNTKDSLSFWASMNPTLQNFLHVPMFMVFIYLCSKALEEVVRKMARRVWIVLGVALFLSIFMEGIQLVIPGRYPSWSDIMLNFIGAVSGVLFLLKIMQNRERRIALY